jgi:hypothetical protein
MKFEKTFWIQFSTLSKRYSDKCKIKKWIIEKTNLSPSSAYAKSPRIRSRSRYLGGKGVNNGLDSGGTPELEQTLFAIWLIIKFLCIN